MTSRAITAELETIMQRNGGILRPADVVDFARDPGTALYHRFEWDDTAAAEKYRIEQARMLIRCTVRVMADKMPPIRAYVSLIDDRVAGDSYRALDDVLTDSHLRDALLAQALQEANAWAERYRHLSELAGIRSAIEAAGGKKRSRTRVTA